MKKILMLLLVCGFVLFAADSKTLGKGNNLIVDDEDSVFCNLYTSGDSSTMMAANDTFYSHVYSPFNSQITGVMSFDIQIDSIGGDSINCDVELWEGNKLGDWNLKTSLISFAATTTGGSVDTTIELNLFPTSYFKFAYINDGGDSCAIDTQVVYCEPSTK